MHTACFLPTRCFLLRRDQLPYPILALLSGSSASAPGRSLRSSSELSMGHTILAAVTPGVWSERLRQPKIQEAD